MKLLGFITALAALASAVPQPVQRSSGVPSSDGLSKRATLCGPQEYLETFWFLVKNGISEAASDDGSQCTTVVGQFASLLRWSTSFTWSGASSRPRSFSRADRWRFQVTALFEYHSLATNWKWSYTGSDVKATVLFGITGGGNGAPLPGSSCRTATPDWSLQVWLGKYGDVAPASTTGSPISIANIGSHTFDVYKATKSSLATYTFVANTTVTDYRGDAIDFVRWLVANEGYTNSTCVLSFSAGTEIFEGTDATFNTAQLSAEQFVRPVAEPVPPIATTRTTTYVPTPMPTPTCVPKWGQCGGIGFVPDGHDESRDWTSAVGDNSGRCS
ncbi:hypothetical protein BN1723_004130 [Verticillium longisporum]|uniref:Endoglucanase n=1 Tax=Verticillium longisporum TaxID=100787 RepID=A0A0G4LAQ8_VERLO|nr:hypothetical protein BN1708_012514 [Verticillium longisporum]CRK35374.1 hypothetical protein BN1723_004130 [Verticillium longisporum]